MTLAVILVAAGEGKRFASPGAKIPKQYRLLHGIPILRHTALRFVENPHVTYIQPVIGDGQQDFCLQSLEGLKKILPPIIGGKERQDSVSAGLEALPTDTDYVLIHDSVRPFVGGSLLEKIITALETHRAVIPTLAIVDTLKYVNEEKHVEKTLPRTALHSVQTPQGFRYHDILRAHREANIRKFHHFTDDASIAEWANIPVYTVRGERENIKITTPEDMHIAEHYFMRDRRDRDESGTEFAVGHGWDVHKFTQGDHIILCGITIPHHASLMGHSDADVGMHAITDALLGAMAQGDIGIHFPPSDSQWRDAASDIFLRHAVDIAYRRGCVILHCDTTFVCEYPKIGPHSFNMRRNIAQILSVNMERVSVKATTSEGLGFTGRGEGIIAMSTISLEKPKTGITK